MSPTCHKLSRASVGLLYNSRMNVLTLVLLLASTAIPTAEEIVKRSVTYHDPEGAWASRPIEITAKVRLAERLAAERGYAGRTDRFLVDNAAKEFRLWTDRAGDRVEIIGSDDVFSAKLNDSFDISEEDQQEFRLARERLSFWRDYFTYVYGMPMKLLDPGTILGEVKRTEFGGHERLSVRVTYSPDVGTDIWYYYFDPQSYALVGCRFYRDEAAKDGEYILYEGEERGPHGLRIPKLRNWHMNIDGEFIASDEVVSVK